MLIIPLARASTLETALVRVKLEAADPSKSARLLIHPVWVGTLHARTRAGSAPG